MAGLRSADAEGAAWAGWTAAPLLRRGWLLGGYLLIFLLLDWASFIRPLQGLNITPWNPQPALAVALLVASRGLWWLVAGGILLADVLVRGLTGDLFVASAAAAALTASYLGIAAALQKVMSRSPIALATMREAGWLLVIIAAGAGVAALAYIGTLAAAGLVAAAPPWVELRTALARYWIGDAVGLLVTLPLLLVIADPTRRAGLSATLRQPVAWLIAALTLALLWFTFGRGVEHPFKVFYLLLLPAVWASVRFGTAGAVLASAATQLGLIAAVQAGSHADLTVFELQLLMAAIATTALLLGIVVDERARSDAELRASLRLAAAGQMSAALAHELSQPLTALASYAQACTLLAEAPGEIDAERRARLVDASRRLAGDARRAADVVKRLRDFFRSGTAQLQRVAPQRLLDEAVAAQRRHAQALGVALQVDVPAALPPVWADAVQMQVVLRNLLGNAIDAAAAGAGERRVQLLARGDAQGLRLEVLDSGAGIAPQRLASLFDAGPSDKPGGMGVGLSICRAIVEAHGGRLWAEPGDGGRLCLVLPAAEHDDAP